MPTNRELRRTAATLHRILELTEVLSDETPKDPGLRARLELTADVLQAAAKSKLRDWTPLSRT